MSCKGAGHPASLRAERELWRGAMAVEESLKANSRQAIVVSLGQHPRSLRALRLSLPQFSAKFSVDSPWEGLLPRE